MKFEANFISWLGEQTLTPSRMLKNLGLMWQLTSLDVPDLFPKKKRHSLFIITRARILMQQKPAKYN